MSESSKLPESLLGDGDNDNYDLQNANADGDILESGIHYFYIIIIYLFNVIYLDYNDFESEKYSPHSTKDIEYPISNNILNIMIDYCHI